MAADSDVVACIVTGRWFLLCVVQFLCMFEKIR